MAWYMDVYLAATIGSTYWGPQERREHLLVSIMTLPKIKKSRVRIHTVTEAYAMFQYENYWRAWWKIFDLKDEHGPKAAIPKKKSDPNYRDFKAKYSDNMVGQVAGGGWSPQAKLALNEIIRNIAASRAEDCQHGWQRHKCARHLVREKHKCNGDTATPAKKRKCTDIVSPPNLTHEDIIIVDDLDAVGDVQIVDDVEIVQRASV